MSKWDLRVRLNQGLNNISGGDRGDQQGPWPPLTWRNFLYTPRFLCKKPPKSRYFSGLALPNNFSALISFIGPPYIIFLPPPLLNIMAYPHPPNLRGGHGTTLQCMYTLLKSDQITPFMLLRPHVPCGCLLVAENPFFFFWKSPWLTLLSCREVTYLSRMGLNDWITESVTSRQLLGQRPR
jgi:hypothetical protein